MSKKEKIIRRILCFLLAASMLLAASCSKAPSSDKEENAPTDEQTETGTVEEKPVYDNSPLFGPLVLSDSDSFTGGTYVSEEPDVSAVEASPALVLKKNRQKGSAKISRQAILIAATARPTIPRPFKRL